MGILNDLEKYYGFFLNNESVDLSVVSAVNDQVVKQ